MEDPTEKYRQALLRGIDAAPCDAIDQWCCVTDCAHRSELLHLVRVADPCDIIASGGDVYEFFMDFTDLPRMPHRKLH